MSYDNDDDNAKKAGFIGGTTTVGDIGLAAAGASAAEIATGLATAGSIVGGGMAAGVGVVAAAPLAVGAAIYGLYKLFSDDDDDDDDD